MKSGAEVGPGGLAEALKMSLPAAQITINGTKGVRNASNLRTAIIHLRALSGTLAGAKPWP